jgi:hypothetical protein
MTQNVIFPLFEIFTTVAMKFTVWRMWRHDVRNKRIDVSEDIADPLASTLMMEVAGPSETAVHLYQSKRRHSP